MLGDKQCRRIPRENDFEVEILYQAQPSVKYRDGMKKEIKHTLRKLSPNTLFQGVT